VPSLENSSQPQKTRLAFIVAQGGSIRAWAKENNVPERTAYRWSTDPDVRAKVDKCRRRCLDRAIGRLSYQVNWAVKGITALGDTATSESVRLAAYKSVFSNLMATSEFADLKDRITELEELLHERERNGRTHQAD
jgi:hypothetical protein